MTIGDKIKELRVMRGMTQSEVVNGEITRNMLSAIESGKSSPSLDTLHFLAQRLEVPVEYLISDKYDLEFYTKNSLISQIKSAYSKKAYQECIDLSGEISNPDDELSLILAEAHFELGLSAAQFGSMYTAANHLKLSSGYCKKTMYNTEKYEMIIPLYEAIINNINAPLLEFDMGKYESDMRKTTHYEFYRYLTSDMNFSYQNQLYKMHLDAKLKIKERKYSEAINILKEIENAKSSYRYNVYLMLGVYADLDNCYKQLYDFENAHRYLTKKITIMENLNA